MSVSGRLRYEILRRDNHTCRYCGARAPDVALTVDHVTPIALGGGDKPQNLVTACADCNAGKSSVPVGAELVADVEADAMRWAAAMKKAGEMQAAESTARRAYVDEFDKAWGVWSYEDGDRISRSPEWASYIGGLFDRGLELAVLTATIDDVMPRRIPDSRKWRYFCGAIRNVMNDRADLARYIIERDGTADGG